MNRTTTIEMRFRRGPMVIQYEANGKLAGGSEGPLFATRGRVAG